MTYLSSVPAVLKLNHISRDAVNVIGPYKHDEENHKPFTVPLKQYQPDHKTPTLGDILRGVDSVTSITLNSSVFNKFADSCSKDKEESLLYKNRTTTKNEIRSSPTSYTELLTSTANERPNKSHGSVANQKQFLEETENILDEVQLRVSCSKNKAKEFNNSNQMKDSRNHVSKKGRKSRQRAKSAFGKSRAHSVTDRLYQSPQNKGTKSPSRVEFQNNGTKTPSRLEAQNNGTKTPSRVEAENRSKQNSCINTEMHKNGLNFGAMQITICKPITIHNNRPEKRETRSEISFRKPSAASSKTVIQTKNVNISKETVILPQMTGNSVIKSDTQTDIIRKTNNFFAPSTQKLPVHIGLTRNQNRSENGTKVTKVYLSDKHSGTLKDCGIEMPCAPPATPTLDQLRRVEYVPSLNDIRSQRAVKVKLQILEKEAQKKMEKQRKEKEELEKQQKKLMEKDTKHQQRLQIYALNKVMTELENSRFKEFCAKKGIKAS